MLCVGEAIEMLISRHTCGSEARNKQADKQEFSVFHAVRKV